MQVNSTTNTTSYINPTQTSSQTQNTEGVLETKFDTSKPFDIESFTFEDYKAIDGQELHDWIKDSDLPNENEISNKVNAFMYTAFYSDDDTLNEIMFDRLDNTYDNGGDFKDYVFTTLLPLGNMNNPIDHSMLEEIANKMADTNGSFDFSTLKMPKDFPTKMESYNKNGAQVFKVEDVLSSMENFREYYNNLDSENKFYLDNPTATYQAFAEITAEYTKRKDEANATLDAYTRNTKQNLIEV